MHPGVVIWPQGGGKLNLFSGVVPVALKQSLNGTLLRHKAIAHNIANVNTPKFKRVDVEFKSQLKAAISRSSENSVHAPKTHLGHMPIDPPKLNPSDSIKALPDADPAIPEPSSELIMRNRPYPSVIVCWPSCNSAS